MMGKTVKLAAMLVVAALFLSGCSGEASKAAQTNPDELAQSLLEQVEFTRELTRVEGDIALQWYFLDDAVEEHAIYIDGSGSSAEEVAVLKAASGADAGDLRAILDQRLETLEFQFKDYIPGEMAKINNPVIEARGDVAVMVVCGDPDSAADIVDKLLG